jgi:diaminopimelate epimerase
MQFTKAHGCGNDFIIVDAREEPSLTLNDLRERAPRLCERRFGVGADGVLWVTERSGRAEMTVINADGSLSEMCGNGLRCVAHYLARRDLPAGGRAADVSAELLTGAGALRVSTSLLSPAGREAVTRVWMGHPQQLAARHFSGGAEPLTTLSMGNPHAVSFHAADHAQRHRLAGEWSREVAGGVNISFALLTPKGVELEVHERGCGWTLACGTGACATVVAGVERGLLPAGQDTQAHLPGGTLTVRYEPGAGVWMTGPSVICYRGDVER